MAANVRIPERTVRLDKWGINTVSKQVLSPVILAVVMFWLAGTTNWLWGWVFSIVHILAWGMMTVVLLRVSPELLNARGRRRPGAKLWDVILVGIYGLDWIVMIILGALDVRYGWTGPMAAWAPVVGNVLIILGFALTTWAMAVNRNFEPIVRIQNDRGHPVVTGGPYRYVRHPGYSGIILAFYFGMPLALMSWPAGIAAVFGLVIMVLRTAMEDRTLHAELPGYAEFAKQTRYRLLPGVW